MASALIKTGIAFPREVLERLDALVREMGLPSRSHAVVEATIKYLAERSMLITSDRVEGIACLIHDIDVVHNIALIEQEHSDVVKVSLAIRLGNHNIVKLIVFEGFSPRIRSLLESLEKTGSIYVITNVINPPKKNKNNKIKTRINK